jgi:hypothetical protein
MHWRAVIPISNLLSSIRTNRMDPSPCTATNDSSASDDRRDLQMIHISLRAQYTCSIFEKYERNNSQFRTHLPSDLPTHRRHFGAYTRIRAHNTLYILYLLLCIYLRRRGIVRQGCAYSFASEKIDSSLHLSHCKLLLFLLLALYSPVPLISYI